MTTPSTVLKPIDVDRQVIARRIRSWRIACGLTLEEVAQCVGVTKGKISKAENNRQNFTLPFLMKFARRMGVQMDYLVGLSNNPEGDPLQSVMASSLRLTESILKDQLKELTQTTMANAVRSVTLESKYQIHERRTADLIASLEQFIKMNNDEFCEMRGGSPVLKNLNIASQSLSDLETERERQTRLKMVAANEAYLSTGKDLGLIAFKEALDEEMEGMNGR